MEEIDDKVYWRLFLAFAIIGGLAGLIGGFAIGGIGGAILGLIVGALVVGCFGSGLVAATIENMGAIVVTIVLAAGVGLLLLLIVGLWGIGH